MGERRQLDSPLGSSDSGGLGGTIKNRRRELLSTQLMRMQKNIRDYNLEVKAGFNLALLPTWGGKAEDILHQPKCWTSYSVMTELRRNEHQRLRKKDKRRMASGGSNLYGKGCLDSTEVARDGTNQEEELNNENLAKCTELCFGVPITIMDSGNDVGHDGNELVGIGNWDHNDDDNQEFDLEKVELQRMQRLMQKHGNISRQSSSAGLQSETRIAVRPVTSEKTTECDNRLKQQQQHEVQEKETDFRLIPAELRQANSILENYSRSKNEKGKLKSATGAVLAKCDKIRGDPSQYQALLRSIQRYRNALVASNKGRNMIIENKWLHNDKKACAEYWNDVRELNQRIAQTESVDLKIGLYGLWPSPPAPNYSRQAMRKRSKERAKQLGQRIEDARNRRERQDTERLERVHALLNKKETKAEQEHAFEKATQVHVALWPILTAARVAATLAQVTSQVLAKSVEKRLQDQMARVIQNQWHRTRASQTGLQFRNAIRVVRRFAKRVAEIRRLKKIDRSVNIIHWFLTNYENSNFQKVMRNYRYRVISCQRYFRAYRHITTGRLKVLSVKWNQIEKDKMRVERQRASMQMRKLQAATGIMSSSTGDTVNPVTIMQLNQQAKMGSSISIGKLVRQSTKNGMRSEKAITRKLSPMALKDQQIMMMQMGGANSNGPFATPHKVPKYIKKEVLKAYLRRQRLDFKATWQQYSRTRKFMEAQSRLMTVEDVRCVVRATTTTEMREVINRKVEDNKNVNISPFLNLMTQTTDAVMGDLVDQGRRTHATEKEADSAK